MKQTKVEVVQRLLDLRQITAEETLTLLEGTYPYYVQLTTTPWLSGYSSTIGIDNTNSAPTYTSTGEQLNLFNATKS